MLEKIIKHSQDLIRFQSDPGKTKELDKALDYVKKLLPEYSVKEFNRNNVKSLLFYNTVDIPSKFKIILNGHLDVIPGKSFQYEPYTENGRIYGVGAMDMKSNLVCAIMAFKEIAHTLNYPLALQIVTDEEVGGFDGTKFQVEKGINADFVIATEPTSLNIVNEAKGIIWLEISCNGKTSHGAYPWRGDNAIQKMNGFINSLYNEFPVPEDQVWKTTVNLSQIETTNTSYNKIPDNCTIKLDIRYINSDKDSILNQIRSIMPSDFKMKEIANEPSLYTPPENKYIKKLQKITKQVTKSDSILYGAQGSSDARHYSVVDTYGIEFGPVGGGIGEDIEWVDIESLEHYYKILITFLLELKEN